MRHETIKQGLVLREATIADCELILSFITKLAIYEEMEDQVEATVESLEESIFNQHAAEVYIIEFDNNPIGYVLTCINFSTFLGRPGMYLEDIFIEETVRGNGYGKAIFVELAKIAKARNYGRIDWVCLDWNEPSHQFYLKIGAQDLPEWDIHRLDEKGIAKLAAQSE